MAFDLNQQRRALKGAALAIVVLGVQACASGPASSAGVSSGPVEALSSQVVHGSGPGEIEQSVRRKLEEARPAGTLASGTGFFVGDGRYFLANAHTVLACQEISISAYDGTRVPARIVSVDARIDAALLRPDSHPNEGLQLGSTRRDEAVAVIGFPDFASIDEPAAVLQGRILTPGTASIHAPLEMQATLRPGSSGSAVLAGDGRVVGLVIGRRSENIGIATSAEQLRAFLAYNGVYDTRPAASVFSGISGLLGRDAASLVDSVELRRIGGFVRPVQCES